MRRLLAVLVLVALVSSCRHRHHGSSSGNSGNDPLPRGSRVLCVDVNAAGDGDYTAALVKAQAAGATAVTLTFDWNAIETAPGVYDDTVLDIANAYYPSRGVSVGLMLRPISTNSKPVPADLAATAFDDPAMIARFNALLDNVLAHVPLLTLTGLGIGSEVQETLGSDAAQWAAYRTLFEAARAHARAVRPGIRVGIEASEPALHAPVLALWQAAETSADIILFSYYPLNSDFTVRDPAEVHDTFTALCDAFPARTIHVNQIGYPTSATCGSSEDLQAAFIAELFSAWDEHASQISLVTFLRLHDYSSAEATAAAGPYGISTPAFIEFLRTLGMRTQPGSGADKAAWVQLELEAAARGW
jgi:hypothetical protein